MMDLIDSDRIAAARLAEATFQQDVTVAISTIEQIATVSTSRVSANMQVASAKMQVDAEVAAAKLAADAMLAVQQYKTFFKDNPHSTPQELVAGVLKEAEDGFVLCAALQTETMIRQLEEDARNAILKIKDMGKTAIDEINVLVAMVNSNIETDAQVAADKLREFRAVNHTLQETADEADEAIQLIEETAARTKHQLEQVVISKVAVIQKTTDDACLQIADSIKASTERIREGKDRSLAAFRVVLMSFYNR
jgi:hypothetical protein